LRGRALDDEAGPRVLDLRDVLHEADEAERARRRSKPRLVIGQALHGLTEEAAVLGEGLEDVGPLRRLLLVDRHGSSMATKTGHQMGSF
jgi:hypothetical protein